MIRYVLLCGLCVAAVSGAMAQTSGTSPGAAGRPQQNATGTKVDKQTMTFIRQAAEGGQFEVASGEIVQQKSENAQVKQFAQQLVQDHTDANNQLVQAAQQAGTSVPSVTLQKKHGDIISDLRRQSGDQLDRRFVNAQITAHQETIQLFDKYSKEGDNAQIKQFAQATLPKLRQHLDHAKELKQALDGGAATGGSSGASSTSKKK